MAGDGELEQLLSEQAAYYHALGEGYLHQNLDLPGGQELAEALEAFRPAGQVLELACGPGVWTGQLLRHAPTRRRTWRSGSGGSAGTSR